LDEAPHAAEKKKKSLTRERKRISPSCWSEATRGKKGGEEREGRQSITLYSQGKEQGGQPTVSRESWKPNGVPSKGAGDVGGQDRKRKKMDVRRWGERGMGSFQERKKRRRPITLRSREKETAITYLGKKKKSSPSFNRKKASTEANELKKGFVPSLTNGK